MGKGAEKRSWRCAWPSGAQRTPFPGLVCEGAAGAALHVPGPDPSGGLSLSCRPRRERPGAGQERASAGHSLEVLSEEPSSWGVGLLRRGCPTWALAFPRGLGAAKEGDRGPEAGATRPPSGGAGRGLAGAQPALDAGLLFPPPSWAPVLGGMLLFKETLLNYFLLIVTFPALS